MIILIAKIIVRNVDLIILCIFLIDIDNEEIHLVTDGIITVDQLSDQIPKDAARYHLYSFSHTYEGSTIQSVGQFPHIFFSSIPLNRFIDLKNICFQCLYILCLDIRAL